MTDHQGYSADAKVSTVIACPLEFAAAAYREPSAGGKASAANHVDQAIDRQHVTGDCHVAGCP